MGCFVMSKNNITRHELFLENENLKKRLEETEETLRALKNGEIDALVIDGPKGEQVFTLKGAEHPYRVLVETMNEGAVTLSHNGTILYCNNRFGEMVKTPKEKAMGSSFGPFLIPTDKERFIELLEATRKKSVSAEMTIRATDGTRVPITLSISSLQVDNFEGFCIILTNITSIKKAEAELRKAHDELESRVEERTADILKSNELLKKAHKRADKLAAEAKKRLVEAENGKRVLEAIMEHIPEGIAIADASDFAIRMISRYGQELIGRPREVIENVLVTEHHEKWQIHYPDNETIVAAEELPLTRAIKLGEIVVNEEWIIRRPGGESVTILCNAGPIKDKSGNITGGIFAWRDITERKKMEAVVRHQAFHDFLTGLPNKMLFIDHLTLALSAARRNYNALAVLFLDLDRFKTINDSLGHSAGDQLLKHIAARLKACVRESDTVARIGGDEYAILLPHIADEEDVSIIAKKILSFLQEPYVIDGHELHITPSVGISIYPGNGENAEILLKNADIAMYHAKEEGRNNYQFYNPTKKISSVDHIVLENNMRQSLKRGELVVYYQPLVSINTRKIVCAEALVRWNHPKLGLLVPRQFLSIAEETGFIMSIDEWVLRTVCTHNKVWQKAGYTPISVSVNISSHLFRQKGFAEMVLKVLQETDFNPVFLELEITENNIMRDIEQTIPNLIKLSDMGITFSIDDFGIGYSSLSYLKILPIQKVKIDKSFISGLATDYNDKAIVNAIITMAHNLKLKVIAEGVETGDQLSCLDSIGCDAIQGFLFSEPLPQEEYKKLMLLNRFNGQSDLIKC